METKRKEKNIVKYHEVKKCKNVLNEKNKQIERQKSPVVVLKRHPIMLYLNISQNASHKAVFII